MNEMAHRTDFSWKQFGGRMKLIRLKHSYDKFSIGIFKILVACSSLLAALPAHSVVVKDTIEYCAQVWVDRTDWARYGGEDEGLSCGGGGASGHSVVMCYIREAHNRFTDALYPNQGTYSNLGHEYGHVRGATELQRDFLATGNDTYELKVSFD